MHVQNGCIANLKLLMFAILIAIVVFSEDLYSRPFNHDIYTTLLLVNKVDEAIC